MKQHVPIVATLRFSGSHLGEYTTSKYAFKLTGPKHGTERW